MTDERRPYTVKEIQRVIERNVYALAVVGARRKPFAYVQARLFQSAGVLLGLVLDHDYLGAGFAKWNPRDAGTQYDYSRERGWRIALGRAIKDIAEQIVSQQATTAHRAADGVPVVSLGIPDGVAS